MAESYQLLTQDDYLSVVRLVAEMAAAEGPDARRSRLTTGICELFRAPIGFGGIGESREAGLEFFPSTSHVVGVDQARLAQALQSGEYKHNPMIGPGMQRLAGQAWAVATREEFFDDRQWCRFPFVQEVLRPLGVGPSLYAASRIDVPRQAVFVTISRGWSDRCRFQPRDVQVVDLLMEMAHRMSPLLHGREIRPGLSPRLRETLKGLLAGQSEKEIARDLGLRCATVHHYVVALYRHFGVSSARELMAALLGKTER